MIMRLLSILLVILFLFLLGLSITMNRNLYVVERVKLMVSEFMYYPRASDFQDVNLYQTKKNTINDRDISHVCGKVLSFKNELPYRYERFIVQVATNKNGDQNLSLPLFDFENDEIPGYYFQKAWNERCK